MADALGTFAIAGNSASPSFEIALPNWADRGMAPCRYKPVVSICGALPGISPIKTPTKGRKILAEVNADRISHPVHCSIISNSKNESVIHTAMLPTSEVTLCITCNE